MATASRTCVIVNPAAGRGRGARALQAVRASFAAVGVTEIRESATHEGEIELAARAIAEGFDTLVVVGGDGTWGNVATAILRSGADCRLALVAAGTGNDFAKTIGAPAKDLAATVRLVVEGAERRVDVGRIEDRWFLNIAGFGFDASVLESVASIRWLRGDVLYLYAALRQLASYEGAEIGITSAARARARIPHLMLVIANARHFGGAFRIAPNASLTDGLLDAIAIADAPLLRRLQLFGAVIRGRHEALPDVDVEQSSRFTLEFASPPAYETDGEFRRATSATVEVTCVPKALRVVVAADAAVP